MDMLEAKPIAVKNFEESKEGIGFLESNGAITQEETSQTYMTAQTH